MADKKKTDRSDRGEKTKRDIKAVQDSLHKVWLAGLGAVARAEEEGSKIFKTLVEKGEEYEKKGRAQLEKVVSQVEGGAGKARESASAAYERVEGRVDELVTAALRRAGIPAREEIATLTRRVEELTRVVEALKTDKQPAAKPASAPKAEPKKPATASSAS